MDFQQKFQLYKFHVKIQVIKHDIDPNSHLNNSRKILMILKRKNSVKETSPSCSVNRLET